MKKYRKEAAGAAFLLVLLVAILVIAKHNVEPLPEDPEKKGKVLISEEQAIETAKQEAVKYTSDDAVTYRLESVQCSTTKRGTLTDYCVTLTYTGGAYDLVVSVAIDRFTGEVISSSVM